MTSLRNALETIFLFMGVTCVTAGGGSGGRDVTPHPTSNVFFGNLLGVPSYWAFPFTGRSHGLAAAAPGHGQVALGAKKVALGPGPPGQGKVLGECLIQRCW